MRSVVDQITRVIARMLLRMLLFVRRYVMRIRGMMRSFSGRWSIGGMGRRRGVRVWEREKRRARVVKGRRRVWVGVV